MLLGCGLKKESRMNTNKEELILTLKTFFKEKADFFGVEIAFLYGSWARGYPRDDSDVDIALIFSKEPSFEEEIFKVLTDISFELSIKMGKEVNIICIDEDFRKPMLYYNAIVLGVSLYTKHFERYVALKNQAIAQMEDFSLFGVDWQLKATKKNLEALEHA